MGKSLRELTRAANLTAEDYAAWGREISKGSDRSMAIIAGANIEGDLIELICEHLRIPQERRDLLVSRGGPLGNFYAAITMAYALGLLDEGDVEDMHAIRTIRNVFAHARKAVDFDAAALSDEVAKLEEASVLMTFVGADLETSRGVFMAAAGNINLGLKQRLHRLRK